MKLILGSNYVSVFAVFVQVKSNMVGVIKPAF